jgi:5'(3')-deoxyribonucleotidase
MFAIEIIPIERKTDLKSKSNWLLKSFSGLLPIEAIFCHQEKGTILRPFGRSAVHLFENRAATLK